MAAKRMERLRYDPSMALTETDGVSRRQLDDLAPRLEEVRREVAQEDVRLFGGGGPIPPEKTPLDAGFFEMPERLLAEYRTDRQTSELGRILQTARRLRDAVDRVVVLGIGGSYMGARALMEGCCEPYFNELSRADRGGHPRMYFQGNNVDNDATAGLLKLLSGRRPPTSVEDRWAIVVISKSGGTLETAVAFRLFLSALSNACGGEKQGGVAELVVPVTGASGRLLDLAKELGCRDVHRVPDGVGGRFSVLSAVGLLPAAILGLDVFGLLEGAAAMNDHFRTAPPGDNAVLDYVGVSHLLEVRRGLNIRVLAVWSAALEAVGLWYDQLLAESLGKGGLGATPLTAINTRDLHSRAQQHQEGRRDKLITNLIVDRPRTDPLSVGRSDPDQDRLNPIAHKTLPDIMAAAVAGATEALHDAGRPTANIHLPRADESSLGQLFQMLMLATVVEGRLLGINPYGQPGVEAYKRNMYRILGVN
jgi:glucose-6-phosphate isomerase